MSIETFETAFRLVLAKEGGYVNDPYDSGGETKYGISKKAYPHLDIKNLTLQQAKEIYYRDYWIPSKADKLPDQLAIMHFDTAVNTGVKTANKILQKALNRQGFDLQVDGIIGPKTLNAIKNANLSKLLADYTIERNRYYAKVGNSRYIKGWINRSISVYDFVNKYSAVALLGIAVGLLTFYLLKKGV
ncbi:glycoside hydrolase family 108 protein [Persephonella sp.]